MFVLGLAALENFLQSGNWVAIGCPAQWINFLGFVIVENEKKTFSGFGETVYALTLTSFGTWALICFGEKRAKQPQLNVVESAPKSETERVSPLLMW